MTRDELDPADADRLALLDRLADRIPWLDLNQHEIEWTTLDDGHEALLVVPLTTFDRKPRLNGEHRRMHPRLEVAMRPPSVFVRELAPAEGQRLKRMAKTAKHQSTRQRAAILLASATRMSVPEIAEMWRTDERHVRRVIGEFNELGFDSLRPNHGGGRPRRIDRSKRRQIVAVAGARPDSQRVPLTRWSLAELSAHLSERGISEISPAHLSRVLAEAGLSFQRTRTWKASPDPAYEAKAERVLSLYERAPSGGVVISFDQMGPLSLRPTQGAGWAGRGRPERHRATFNRRHGVRYLFAALDVHAERLRGRLRPRRRGADTLGFMRMIRLCYPRRLTLHWIQDNLSANWTPDIRTFAAENRIELVPLPTYASYLNRIESHFLPITEFVVNNADYLDWDAFAHAMAAHISYRNGRHRDRRLQAAERKLLVAA